MYSDEDFQKYLKDVDPQLCAAFALRCSLRSLPIVVVSAYSGRIDRPIIREQQIEYLFAEFVYLQRSLNFLSPNFWMTEVLPPHNVSVVSSDLTKVMEASYIACLNSVYASLYADGIRFFDKSSGPISLPKNGVSKSFQIGPIMGEAAKAVAFNEDTELSKRCYFTHVSNLVSKAAEAAVLSSNNCSAADAAMISDLERIQKKDIMLTNFLTSSLWESEPPKEWALQQSNFNEMVVDGLDADFDIWLDWYQDRVDGKPINFDIEKEWANIPDEVKHQGVRASNDYLALLRNKEPKKPLNLVRGIFIGNGAAGKTSLIRALHNEAVVEGKEEMTPGIAIREWAVPETEIKARLWDFGGQVMSHSTHQFFLRERCLYILVLDARSEFNANDQAEYWLEHVKAFGKNASVMLVGNKSDLTEVNLDMHALKEKYSNIVGFYPLSCTDKTPIFIQRFAIFQTQLVEQLKAVGTHKVYFTDEQFNVLKTLREQSPKQAFLPHKDFDQLCSDNNIGQEGLSKKAFLGLLDSLGEVIHFPNFARLDEYVLNPRWLTYGVYTLLYADITTKQKGQLSERDVIDILQNEKVIDEHGNTLDYPSSKCGFIIDAMTEFKLCYRLPSDSKRIVIPDKLRSEQPDLSNDFDISRPNVDRLAFEFIFRGFLPRHVMPNLIVTRHDEIVDDLVWQNGVILRSERHQALARVQVDYHKRVLQVWVQGEGRREFLEILNDEVNKILKRMEKLEYDEVVMLPVDALILSNNRPVGEEWHDVLLLTEKAPYKRLIAEARSGQQITISNTGKSYDLNKVMGLIMSEEKHAKKVTNIHFMGNAKVGAIGGSGDNQRVVGTVVVNESDKAAVADYQGHIEVLMKHIENYDADFKVKIDAYNELREIRETLVSLETSTPESRGKLGQFLSSIKEGSLGALKLGNEIKDAQETVTFLIANAAGLGAFLSSIGMIG